MNRSRSIGLLLGIERMKDLRRSDSHRLVGPALAVGNLLILAYAERFVRDDPAILPVILAAEIVSVLLLSGSHLLSNASPSLDRTALYPLSAAEKHRYLLADTLRRTPVLLWSCGMLLAFFIFTRASMAGAIGAVLLVLLLIVTTESWLAFIFLRLRHGRLPEPWILAAPFLAVPLADRVAVGFIRIPAGEWWDAAGAAVGLLALFILSFTMHRRER